jgi:hypothetical protein
MSSNPNVSVETIADTTHFLPMERPDLVRQLLAAHCHGLASTHGAAVLNSRKDGKLKNSNHQQS